MDKVAKLSGEQPGFYGLDLLEKDNSNLVQLPQIVP